MIILKHVEGLPIYIKIFRSDEMGKVVILMGKGQYDSIN